MNENDYHSQLVQLGEVPNEKNSQDRRSVCGFS